MDSETLDESNHTLPEEAIREIKLMCKWMTFTAVLLIILAILGILGNLGNYSSTGSGIFLFSILMNGVSIYLGFMVLKKSGFFNLYADDHDDEKLEAAMKLNRLFWMLSTLMLIVSFIISLSSK